MFISYATGTTDVCALQKHLTMLTYHKGLWCSLGMMLYRHLLAYIQMLEMTLFKPPFVDAVLPFMLFAYEPRPSLPHSAAHQSLPPSLIVPTSKPSSPGQPRPFATSWQRYLHCPFQAGSHLSQAVSLHSWNSKLCGTVQTNLKNASPLKAILYHITLLLPIHLAEEQPTQNTVPQFQYASFSMDLFNRFHRKNPANP